MFCTNCGGKIPEGASFCTSCGKQASPEAQHTSEGLRVSQRPSWSISKVLGLAFLIMVAVVIGAAIIGHLVTTPQEKRADGQFLGVRIEDLEFGPRDSQRRSPVSMRITNTTDRDIPGMQIAFVARDANGQMGPFWLPKIGHEADLALKAGESRTVFTYLIGFGLRDMSNAKPVDAKILGADVKRVADLPEAERRAIFAEWVGCEDTAGSEALKKYPEDFSSAAAQVERQELRWSYEKSLRETCQERVRLKRAGVNDEQWRLIVEEGILMHWPPLGNN